MIKALFSLYSWRYPLALVYMLQSTEYRAAPYLKWYWHTIHFERVMYRRKLHLTLSAGLLVLITVLGILAQLITGVVLMVEGLGGEVTGGVAFGLATLIAYPVVWAHLIVVPL